MSKPTKESIEALLKKSPYSASNQAALEAYVVAQARGEAPYFMDANRCLLKLYQFSPQSAQYDKVALILLLGLLEFPATDVLALRYLIPDKAQKMEPCKQIIACASLLDSCKFSEFWREFRNIQTNDTIKGLAGPASTEKLQRAMIEVLALSYRTASLTKVLSALNMRAPEDFVGSKYPCVESVDDDKVIFVTTADNTRRTRVFQEGVNYTSIASMMAKVSCE